MIDVAYVLGTVAFFALMLGYVRACEVLGQRGASGSAATSHAAGRDAVDGRT